MNEMKKIIFSLTLLLSAYAQAQIVSDKSNEILLNFTAEQKNTSLPTIFWISPRLEFTNTQESRIQIKASVSSSIPLKKVHIAMKKSKEGSSLGTRMADMDDPYNVNIDLSLLVSSGENWIEIIAENEDGGMVRDFRNIRVGMDAIGSAVMADRKDYALLFAINKFDNWNDLVNPIPDAEAIADELRVRYGFEVEIVRNSEQDEVMTKLREYAQRKYKPQDQLFIFFAGHGVYDEVFGEGFLVARNSVRNDVSKNTYISHNRIRSNIDNIPCQHIFLTMDACFGGTFDPVLAASRAAYYEVSNNQEYLVKKLSKKTRKYLTSGSKEYVPDGIPGHHSPFAANFLEALKSNGGEDRILILDEIKLYMERLRTTPRFGSFGTDENGSDFVFVAP